VITHLPILQVVLPLLAAPCALLIGKARPVWIFTWLVSAAAFAISVLLLREVQSAGVIVYALGGWDAPWGIEYRIDMLNVLLLLLITGISTVVLLAAQSSIEHEIGQQRQPLFYVLFLLCLAGLLGMVATGDAFNVFVFLEISSLATYGLVALGRDKRAVWAAYQYLVMGTIGATFILIGIGLMYIMTGTLNMADLAQRLPALSGSATITTSYTFLVVGVCLKLAMFPLHFWLPNAYTHAPATVTAFLAATATKVALYLLIRFTYTVYGAEWSFANIPLGAIFLVLGLVAIFSASLVAIYQDNLKRLFAYSSVAQIGYMIVGMGLATQAGLQATLLHLFNHALMKGALFLALAAMFWRLDRVDFDGIRGLGRRMPLTMAAIVVGGLSLIGVPLTAGFISKWYLVSAAIAAGHWWVAALILLGSLLALLYVWRIVEAAYFREPTVDLPAQTGRLEAPLLILIPTWIMALANIWFGIDPRLPIRLSEAAANALMWVGG